MKTKYILIFQIIFLLSIFSVIAFLLFNSREADKQETNNSDDNTVEEEVDEFQEYSYEVVNSYPHDKDAFTQGLVYHEGYLYEGTGLNGSSSIRKVELETGNVIKQEDLSIEFFGEGITIWEDEIIQLSWKGGKAFVYDLELFELQDTFTYSTPGWGLTQDGEYLIMSDGTDKLYFLDPDSYQQEKFVRIHDERGAVNRINELEYINGKIYANIWKSNDILIINPESGKVEGRIDLSGILESEGYDTSSTDVLNGIAYDSNKDRLFVTGKLWPVVFEIELLGMV